MNRTIGAIALFLVLVIGMGFYGCVGPNPTPPAPTPQPTPQPNNPANHTTSNQTNNQTTNQAANQTTNQTGLSQSNNQFAFDLYSKYSAKQGNIFFSPWSITSAVAMTYEGAKGQTASEIQNVFYFPADKTSLETQYQSVNRILNPIVVRGPADRPIEVKPYSLWNANSLWVEKTEQLDQDYATRMQTYYDGKISQLDFKQAPEDSRNTINKWVEDKTNNRIQDLLPAGSIQSATRMVLANAIYMKANWTYQFKKEGTQEKDFTLVSGQKTKAQMMHNVRHFTYGETNELQIVELPYEGDDLSMLVILPREKSEASLAELENELSPENLNTWKGSMTWEEVDLSLPKFKFDTTYTLANDLKAMGMPTAFGSNADFSGMGIGQVAISEVYHKAFVAVDEAGTEAAAATAVVMVATAMQPGPEPPPPKVFNADHPFIFLIQEKATGNILFLGRMSEP